MTGASRFLTGLAARIEDSGEHFVIFKATESNAFTDGTFRDRWADAGRNGLPAPPTTSLTQGARSTTRPTTSSGW